MSMERLELTVDGEMLTALRREASEQGVAIADLVREALATYLDLGHMTPDLDDEGFTDEAEEEDDDWADISRELSALVDDDE
jgi:hypothetical protein